MNGFSIKAKFLALAALAATMTGSGLASLPIAAEPQKQAIETTKQPVAQSVDSVPDLDKKSHATRPDHFGDPLPVDALARFGTVRFRQGFNVNAICYSPDEKTIAIAGRGRSLGLWDVATGKELFQFDDGTGTFPATNCIAFSLDGKILAAGGNAFKIQLWNARTGELIRDLKAHWPHALAFSSDGKTVISGGRQDGTIRFWDVSTGRETAKIEKQAGTVWALALSSDGKLLASGGSAKVIRLWDVESRKLLKELQGHHAYIGGLSFSPNVKQLVSAGHQCIVWDVTKGEAVREIWDVTKGEAVRELDEGHNAVRTAVFSPNGKWLAAGCSDGAIRLYDPSTGNEVRHWETQSISVETLNFSRDSKTIAASSARECGVRFWDVESGKETRPLDVHRSPIDEVQLSNDGKSLWGMGRWERRMIRWNTATADPVEVVPIPFIGLFKSNGALAPGGDFLAWSSASDKTVHLMDLKSHKDACEPLKIGAEAVAVQFSPDTKALAVGCDGGRFYIWKWQTQRNPTPLIAPDGERIRPWLFTPDGKQLLIGSLDPLTLVANDMLHVWDVATERKIFSFSGNKSSNALAISPDGKWLASTAWRNLTSSEKQWGRIKVIDFEKGKTIREIKIDPEGGTAVAFSPDGRVLAFGEQERRHSDVKLIEFATGEPIATFRGHHSGVFDLQFAPDGRTLISGGGDSTILKWDSTARHGKGASTPNLAAAWEALTQEAIKAYPAGWDLVDARKEAVALLRKKILPAKKPNHEEVKRLVDGLDSNKFQDRNKASALLKSFGYSVEPLLRTLVETENRPEVKERLQKLIDEFSDPELKDPSFLQTRRAIQVLETIGSDDAKQLLREFFVSPSK